MSVAAEEIEDLTQDNKRLTAQVKADRRLREQHASLLAKSKAAREQAAAQAARAAALEEELAQLSAKVCSTIMHSRAASDCERGCSGYEQVACVATPCCFSTTE